MAHGRPILGVDITPTEIRVVEMRGVWPDVQIVRADYSSVPPGALSGAQVAAPELLGGALRTLIQKMGVEAKDAIIGIPGKGVTTRVIEVPNVPDREMPLVVEGELEHYQILREGAGKFDYARLTEGTTEDGTVQLLLMASEDAVINGYRQAAAQAGIKLSALEPTLLGLYRASFAQSQSSSETIILSLTHSKTELSIVSSGSIRLYRRIDIGTDDLVGSRLAQREDVPGSAGPTRLSLLSDDEEEPAPSRLRPSEIIDSGASSNLATEIQRSLSYYRRKNPEAAFIQNLVVATNDPEAAPLKEWLAATLELQSAYAVPPPGWATGYGVAEKLELPDGLRYLAAIGLATHGVGGLPDKLPRFDLSSQERVDLNVEAAKRKLAGSLTGAIAALFCGTILAFGVGIRANIVQTQVDHAKQELGYKQQRQQFLASSLQARIDQLTSLQKNGLAVTSIMDAITGALDPQAGLNESGVDARGRVYLAGEAANDNAVIRTVEGLKFYSMFDNPTVDSFDSAKPGLNLPEVVRFKISSQLAGFTPPVNP